MTGTSTLKIDHETRKTAGRDQARVQVLVQDLGQARVQDMGKDRVQDLERVREQATGKARDPALEATIMRHGRRLVCVPRHRLECEFWHRIWDRLGVRLRVWLGIQLWGSNNTTMRQGNT